MLKVYGRANSINVRRVLWMLEEVGEKYEREDWGRGFRPTDDPEFRKINPAGVVPVIDDGDFRAARKQHHRALPCREDGRADLFRKDLRTRAHRVVDGFVLDGFCKWHAARVSRSRGEESLRLSIRSTRASRSGAGR